MLMSWVHAFYQKGPPMMLLEVKGSQKLTFWGYYSESKLEEWEQDNFFFIIILECIYLALRYIKITWKCVHAFLWD